MKRFIAATLLAGTAVATPAAAAPLFFDFVSDNPAQSVSFTFYDEPTPSFSGGVSLEIGPIAVKGSSGVFNGLVEFRTFEVDGGFRVLNGGNVVVSVFGPQIFAGRTEFPSFYSGWGTFTGGNGFADGTLTVRPATAAVPEPATWAMMILGMGAVGYAMRRRQKVTAKVHFA